MKPAIVAGILLVVLWVVALIYGGITLAHNVRSPAKVDAVLAEAEAAGATIARSAAETFWGGYSGVFVDPDGHPWEVAHNPYWVLADDGSVSLPG